MNASAVSAKHAEPFDDSPLANYERDEAEGRKAWRNQFTVAWCPHPAGNRLGDAFNNRRKAWLSGFYDEQYSKNKWDLR